MSEQCSVCEAEVEDGQLTSTYCGSMCASCLSDHIAECDVCGAEYVSEVQEAPPVYRVEFDRAYSGGEYSGVGEFVSVAPDPDETVERAFERVTGLWRGHIVHYEWAELLPEEEVGDDRA